jgi:RNA polymerase sigma-70 factor, ECF subfamily
VDDRTRADTAEIERLVQASQSGDKGAFDGLVRLYQMRAMQAAVRILGDANDAAEAVQNGFVTAYLKIGKLRDAKRFEFWLLRIIVNAAISERRAAVRRVEKIKIVGCQANGKTIDPAENESSDELSKAIKNAMSKLSRKETKAISLFGLEGLSHQQVAEIIGCSVAAARWHVFRARQKLKVLLKEYL